MARVVILVAVVASMLQIMAGSAARTTAQRAPRAPQAAGACGREAEELIALTLRTPQTGRVDPGWTKCYRVSMARGEFIRMSLAIESGYARARVFGPASQDKALVVGWAWGREFVYPSMPIAFRAESPGFYVIEVSFPPMERSERTGPFTLEINEWLTGEAWVARQTLLEEDPRTSWLRDNAVPIRTVDPHDEDFSDLEFLRRDLQGVRLVLLGESDHGNGTDFEAKTRLVKFLHREMGFDVLAFESGMFGASEAWVALQTEMDPREAFLKGIFGIWGWSEQVQPLVRYLANSARTERPLELAGFDSQFTGTASPSQAASLRQFLIEHEIGGALADPESRATQTLQVLLAYPPQPGLDRPTEAELAELEVALQVAADEIKAGAATREGAFWQQQLRSALAVVSEDVTRDQQMARNLLWLTETHYPGRKIIAWMHNLHAIRNPQLTVAGEAHGFTLGHGVWKALGSESFTIGFTSYAGTIGCVTCTGGMEGMRQDIPSDQHDSFEFEELMAAAGFGFAFVNLRAANTGASWLRAPFLARPLLTTEDAQWSEILDALFFIRAQQPSTRVRETG